MIPKCGTHLLIKSLALMGLPYKYDDVYPFEKWYQSNKRKNKLPPPRHHKGFWHPFVDGPMPKMGVAEVSNQKSFYVFLYSSGP